MAGDIKLPDLVSQARIDTKGVDAGLNKVSTQLKGVGGVADATGSKFAGLSKLGTSAVDSVSSSLTSQLGPASGAAEAALGKLSSTGSLLGPAIAGGVALAGVAVAKFALDGAQAFVGLAGEVRNFQRASGASAEDSSRFVAVLDDLGVSSEVGSKAIFKLSREIGEGGKKLAEYGVEVARAKDGTVDTTGTLLNLADAYVKTTDPGQRAAMVMNTLGKSGQALVPVLEQGRAGLKAFFDSAEGGRQIFSQEDLDKARKYELAVDDLQDTFRGLQMEAGEALLPFLTTLADAASKTLAFIDKIGSVRSGIEGGIGGAASAVVGPLGHLGGLIFGLGGKSDNAKKSTKELAEEVKASAAASEEDARAKAEQAAALDKVTNATLSTVSSQLGYQASVNTLKDNINDLDDRTREYSEAVAKNGANSKEAEAANRALRDAHLGIEQSAVAAAGAAVRLASDTAEAGGQALTAQQKADIFKAELRRLAAQADGPSRDAINRLAEDIDNIPNRQVQIDADTSAALAKISYLERRLSAISATDVSTPVANAPGRHAGGPVRAGKPYVVGEYRPELFVPEVNGYIVPRVPTASGAPAGAAGGDTIFNVYPSAGMDERDLAILVAREQAWAAGG